MVELKDKCIDCIHHDMCKYSELYTKYCSRISNYIHDLECTSDQICNVDITCKYFIPIKPVSLVRVSTRFNLQESEVEE